MQLSAIVSRHYLRKGVGALNLVKKEIIDFRLLKAVEYLLSFGVTLEFCPKVFELE